MKSVLFVVLLVASSAFAAPAERDHLGRTAILQHDLIRDEYGQYIFRYVSGDGTIVTEQGSLKPNAAGNAYILTKQGSVSYFSPEGKHIAFEYIADENGFRHKEPHNPTI